MVRLWIFAKGVLLCYMDGAYIWTKASINSHFLRSLPEGIKTIPDLTYLTGYYFNQTL